MMFRCVLPALLLFVVVAPAFGQVELKHKFQEGSSFSTEAISQVNQTLTIAGMDMETSAETIVNTKTSVQQKNADGQIPIKSKIESMQITMNVQGSEYSFDSANPDDKGTSQLEMLRDIHKAIVGRETTLVIDEDGKVSEVQAPDLGLDSLPVEEFMSRLPALDDDFKARSRGASRKGKVLRYAATIDKAVCRVGLTEVAVASPMGRLAGTDQRVEIRSRWYTPEPLVIRGRGAGAEATAAGVLSDIVELARISHAGS